MRADWGSLPLVVYRYIMLVWILSGKNAKGLIGIHLWIILLMHVIVVIFPSRVLLLLFLLPLQCKTLWVLGLSAHIDWNLIIDIIGRYWAAYLFNCVSIILVGVHRRIFIWLLLLGKSHEFGLQTRRLFFDLSSGTVAKLWFETRCTLSWWVRLHLVDVVLSILGHSDINTLFRLFFEILMFLGLSNDPTV